MDHVETPLPQM